MAGMGVIRLLAGQVQIFSWVAPDDRLSGGSGADILDGGGEHDTLLGGAGRDLLVGGASEDTLVGGGGSDLLIGQQLSVAGDSSDVRQIRSEWLTGRGYRQRVRNILDGTGSQGGGRNGSIFLPALAIDREHVDELFRESVLDFLWGEDNPLL